MLLCIMAGRVDCNDDGWALSLFLSMIPTSDHVYTSLSSFCCKIPIKSACVNLIMVHLSCK